MAHLGTNPSEKSLLAVGWLLAFESALIRTEMRLGMIKLIAADLDDTLLDENAKLSEENKRVIAQAMDQGVIFTLSTGRMFQSAAPFVRELGATDDLPIICYNGALIKRLSGETLHEETLAPELSSMIADYG